MIISTLLAATIAAQAAPASVPSVTPAPSAEKKMACCEKTEKGAGCCCCKDMGKDQHAGHDMEGMSHEKAH
jgi:hypothetical protein